MKPVFLRANTDYLSHVRLNNRSKRGHFRSYYKNSSTDSTLRTSFDFFIFLRKMILLYVIVMMFFCETFGCREENFTQLVVYERPQKRCDDHTCFHVTTENATGSSSITCSNIFSIGQISYSYKERDYEQFLIITDSNISTIHSMELYKFPSIVKLHLNQLSIKTISPGAFAGLTRLRELYLNDNELSELSNGVYNHLRHLEILNLTNNQIFKIENGAFIGLYALTTLHLKNNNLTTIEDNFFETLNHLKKLDISQNPLGKFPFDKLASIDDLALAETEITEMETDLSKSGIHTLDLSFCQITKVDFALFPTSDEIDLSNNEITSVVNCDKLKTVSLNLNNNQIKTINENFQDVSKIYLGHNDIQVLEKSVFGDLQSVLVLDLGYNQFTRFVKDYFHNLTSLQILKLPHNDITKIDTLLFRDLTNLKILDLSENRIDEFQYGVFDSLKNLEILDISGNKLLELHQYTFNSLSNLLHLRFDNNQISSFDVKDLNSHLPKLMTVSLDENPWKCKNLVDIETFFKSNHIEIATGHSYDVENFHGIACSNPRKFDIRNDSSGISVKELARSIQEAISEGVRNSKVDHFFNEDFGKSKFLQYFEKDYSQSDFFKYFNKFKFSIENQEGNGSKTEKLTALEVAPVEDYGKILVFSVVVQVLTCTLLLFVVYLMFSFIKKQKPDRKPELSSQMELC